MPVRGSLVTGIKSIHRTPSVWRKESGDAKSISRRFDLEKVRASSISAATKQEGMKCTKKRRPKVVLFQSLRKATGASPRSAERMESLDSEQVLPHRSYD